MKFSDTIIRNFNSVKFKAEKYSPEILIGVGIVSFVGTIAYTIKGGMKAGEVIESSEYRLTEADGDEELQKNIKLERAGELAKTFAPTVILGGTTLACFLTSNHIIQGRLIGTAAAYTALETGFNEYRNRVINKYGEAADREFKYGIVEKKVKETEVDETTGKKVKTTKTVQTIEGCSPFGIYFKRQYDVQKNGKTLVNPNFQTSDIFNTTFIEAQRSWFNGKLDRGERVYLSDVLKALGIPEDDYPDARVVGWFPNGEGSGDHYIRFNAYQPENCETYISNDDGEILLDFNVDGTILYK